MDYHQFRETVLSMVKERIKEGESASITHVLKNNGVEMDGLTIMKPNRNMSPTVYLDSFYGHYQEGAAMEEVVGRILEIFENEPVERLQLSDDFFTSFASVEEQIVYKVINYEQNKKLLEQVPHKRMLDLAMVFCCLLRVDDGGASTILIYRNHLEQWGITQEALYDAAFRNTPRLFGECLREMEDLLGAVSQEGHSDCPKMMVLTNDYGMYGAGAMFYEQTISQIADKNHADLLILPSSIHEVIVILKEEFREIATLKTMVREMNDRGLSKEEVLSYNIYCYDQESKTLNLA